MYGAPLEKRLGIKTPAKTLQRSAAKQLPKGSKDPLYPSHTLKKPGVPDHIVPVDRIRNIEGFAQLNKTRQSRILNWEENFQALSEESNLLKKAKSYREMADDPQLGAVDKQFVEKMVRKEDELWQRLKERVQKELKEQYEYGESPFGKTKK